MSEWLARARAARAERRAKETINAPHDGSLSLPPETDITAETLTDKTDVRRDHLVVVPDLSNPEDIQAWLIQRTAMREDSGTARVDANRLAFDELLWIWHAANPVAHAHGQCAACGTEFKPPVMSLPDGAQVCNAPENTCLIAYGNSRRTEAVNAPKNLGIEPPAWWEL